MKKSVFQCAGVLLSMITFIAATDNALNLDQFAQALKDVRSQAIALREQNMSKEDWLRELEKEGLSKEVPVLPVRYKLKPGTELKMQLPLFGLVVFKPIFDNKGYVEGFQSISPSQEKSWNWGPLIIEQGLFKMIDGKLSYLAWGSFFGKKISIGLKQFSLINKEEKVVIETIEQKKVVECYRMVIGVAFEDGSFSFDLLPGRSVKFKTLDIVFEEGKGLYLQHEGEIFGQPVTVSASIESVTKEFKLSADISQRPLTTILPEFKNTVVDGLTITGTMSFAHSTGMIIQGKIMNDVETSVEIAGIVLEDAKIDVDTKKGHALISGAMRVLGLPLRGYFALLFGGKQKGIKFTADVPNKVKDWKPFIGTSVGGLNDIVVHEIKAALRAQYNAAENGDKKIEKQVFSEKPEDIIERAEEITLDGPKGVSFSFFIMGTSTILNTKTELIFKIAKQPQGGFAITFCGLLPQGWKLSQSFPDFFKPTKQKSSDPDPASFWRVVCDGIDTFKFERARIIASTTKEIIEEVAVEPGLNIMADITVDAASDNEFIKGLARNGILKEGSQGAQLGLRGNINPTNPRSASFTIDVSTGGYGLTLGPARFDGGALGLVLRGDPSLGVAGMFRMKPDEKSSPIQFYLRFFLTPLTFGIEGSMKGTWKNPFGVKGFEFGDLGVKASQSYTAFNAEALATFGIAALVPAEFGFTGAVKFGEGECFSSEAQNGDAVCANATLNLGKDITNLALAAEITSPLSLVKLLDILLAQMDAQTDLFKTINTLVPVKVDKGSLYFVPLGTNIGQITIKQGIGASLYLDLFGRKAHVDGNISLEGFTAKGKIPAFEWGPLVMTNADETCDTKTGDYKNPKPEQKDETCGPMIDIQANVKNIHFIIDGMMKIGDILQSRTKMYLSLDGLHFETHTFIGPKNAHLGLRLKGSSISFKDPINLIKLDPKDLFLEIDFEDNLTEQLQKDIADELVAQKEAFEHDINFALDQLSRQTIKKDIDEQQEKVYKAARERVSFFSNPIISVSRESAYRSELVKLEGLKVKFGLESSFIGQILSELARRLGIDKVAEHLLMGLRTIGLGTAERIELFFKDISKLVIVKRAYWKGSVADLAKGVLPSIELHLCMGCETIKVHTPEFDLRKPIDSAHSLAFFSIKIIHDAIIKSFEKKECDRACGNLAF